MLRGAPGPDAVDPVPHLVGTGGKTSCTTPKTSGALSGENVSCVRRSGVGRHLTLRSTPDLVTHLQTPRSAPRLTWTPRSAARPVPSRPVPASPGPRLARSPPRLVPSRPVPASPGPLAPPLAGSPVARRRPAAAQVSPSFLHKDPQHRRPRAFPLGFCQLDQSVPGPRRIWFASLLSQID